MSIERLARVVAAAKVVASSVVTLMITVSTGVTVFAAGIADEWPDGARWALVVAGAIGSAAAAVRRVTPVPPPERGLLPSGERG